MKKITSIIVKFLDSVIFISCASQIGKPNVILILLDNQVPVVVSDKDHKKKYDAGAIREIILN